MIDNSSIRTYIWELWSHKVMKFIIWAKKKKVGSQVFLPLDVTLIASHKIYYRRGNGVSCQILSCNVSCMWAILTSTCTNPYFLVCVGWFYLTFPLVTSSKPYFGVSNPIFFVLVAMKHTMGLHSTTNLGYKKVFTFNTNWQT
jgi:hypothetical protein